MDVAKGKEITFTGQTWWILVVNKEGKVTVQVNQRVLLLCWIWHPVSASLNCEHAGGMLCSFSPGCSLCLDTFSIEQGVAIQLILVYNISGINALCLFWSIHYMDNTIFFCCPTSPTVCFGKNKNTSGFVLWTFSLILGWPQVCNHSNYGNEDCTFLSF